MEISASSLLLRAGAVLVLIAANAFFVAAEFALVATRRTRIEELAQQGDRGAQRVRTALDDLYRQLSAAQLGITLASILLGYVAEGTIAVVLHGWFATLPPAFAFLTRAAVASVIAVTVITFLHVVIGEQAPKAWAITHAERTSRWIAAPLMFFAWVTSPVTNLLNWSANRVVRLMGISGTGTEVEPVHSPEEIVMLLKRSQESGHLDREDVRMIEGVFEFTEKRARDVMTPRTNVVGLPAEVTIAEAAARAGSVGRSRYPLYEQTLDEIVGVVHVKQILAALGDRAHQPVRILGQPPLFVPGTREVEDVLADMKRLKIHVAIVLDEFGGTAGLVTMEDLLEEIVGEIYDEHDHRAPRLPPRDVTTATLPGDTELDDVNARYGVRLEDDDYQTIGGWVFGRLGRLPRVGDRVTTDTAELEVTGMEGRRVTSVRLTRRPDG